jgi:hypothetical protein
MTKLLAAWDLLAVKYVLLALLAIWATLLLVWLRRRWWAWLGTLLLAAVLVWLALGIGFSVRLPYPYDELQILRHVVHGNRVHALVRPVGRPELPPVHMIFSIDPGTKTGARLRKSFFDALRAREGKKHNLPIILDRRAFRVRFGKLKYRTSSPFPPKRPPLQ